MEINDEGEVYKQDIEDPLVTRIINDRKLYDGYVYDVELCTGIIGVIRPMEMRKLCPDLYFDYLEAKIEKM